MRQQDILPDVIDRVGFKGGRSCKWGSSLTPWSRGGRAGEAKLFLYADDIFQLSTASASSALLSLD